MIEPTAPEDAVHSHPEQPPAPALRLGSVLLLLLLLALAAAAAAGGLGDPRPSRHVIYLHGRIVQEQQSARPRHPTFGYYELEKIREAFRERGFEVSAEIRPKPASAVESADRVAAQVRRLLASGVPPDHITVVGASMGGYIALLASTRLQNPELRFVVLSPCLSESVPHLLAEQGKKPSGHLLAIREASDTATGPCRPWQGDADPRSTLQAREIVIKTGLDHGFLYRPLPEWLEPAVAWAGGAVR